MSAPQNHLSYRKAELADIAELEELIRTSARELQLGFYSPEQIEGALGTVFGVDSQLIRDGTYYVATDGESLVACGGWSQRKTAFGADAAKSTEDPLRDPVNEPAMIRAFFIHPHYARRGIGRELLRLGESAARAAGFSRAEMVATLAGEPLYHACGYAVLDRYEVPLPNGFSLPVVRMGKAL